jgi:hypothetical protein
MKQQEEDVDVLNEILAELNELPKEQSQPVLEHLGGARFYITGVMPEELELNLKMAEGSLGSLPDGPLKSRIRDFIAAHRP